MEAYHWLTLALGALGFIVTWFLGAFKLGRSVEQMKAAIKTENADERNKIIDRVELMERRFEDAQKDQDHNYGEVAAAVRQYVADVEKKVREVELYGRDNYVRIPEFEKAMDRLSGDLKSFAAEIKKDFSERMTELKGQLK
jgi:DNA-binding transcriptional MerR regulator